MATEGEKVQLYVYDLSGGMARQLSPMLLGKQVEGIWHTGLVVGGVEHFYGYGLQHARAGCSPFGHPHRVLDLGCTQVDAQMREQLLQDLAPRYGPQDYSLLFHNCNTFSNEFSLLLTGQGIPEYVLSQAQEVLSTPFGEMMLPMLMQMEAAGFGRAAPTGPSSGQRDNPFASTSRATGGVRGPTTTTTTSVTVTASQQGPAVEAVGGMMPSDPQGNGQGSTMRLTTIAKEGPHEGGGVAIKTEGANNTEDCAVDCAVGSSEGGPRGEHNLADQQAGSTAPELQKPSGSTQGSGQISLTADGR